MLKQGKLSLFLLLVGLFDDLFCDVSRVWKTASKLYLKRLSLLRFVLHWLVYRLLEYCWHDQLLVVLIVLTFNTILIYCAYLGTLKEKTSLTLAIQRWVFEIYYLGAFHKTVVFRTLRYRSALIDCPYVVNKFSFCYFILEWRGGVDEVKKRTISWDDWRSSWSSLFRKKVRNVIGLKKRAF